jgi:hypothetical protein
MSVFKAIHGLGWLGLRWEGGKEGRSDGDGKKRWRYGNKKEQRDTNGNRGGLRHRGGG